MQTQMQLILLLTIVLTDEFIFSIQNKNNLSSSLAQTGFKMKGRFKWYEKIPTRMEMRDKRSTFTKDPCYHNSQCKKQERNDAPICYCDNLCKWFGDCCYDANVENVIDESWLPSSKQLKCVYYKGVHKEFEGYWMITSCPQKYQNQLVDYQCHTRKDFIHNLPVFDKNGLTYGNMFCAICNGIENFTMSVATFDISTCKNKEFDSFTDVDFESIMRCSRRSNNFPPKSYNFRTCWQTKTDGTSSNPICTQYQNPIITKTHMIKNYFCNPIIGFQSLQCLPEDFIYPPALHSAFPLTVLLHFTIPKLRDNTQPCTEVDRQGLLVTGLCFEDTCEEGMRLSNGLCYKNILHQNTQHSVLLFFESNRLLDYADFKRFTYPLYFGLKNQDYVPISYKFHVYETNSSTAGTRGTTTITVVFKTKHGLNLQQIASRKKTFLTYHVTYIENKFDTDKNEETRFILRPIRENETLSEDSILNTYDLKSNGYAAAYPTEKPWFAKTGFCSNTVIETMSMNQTQFDSIKADKTNASIFKFLNQYLMVTSTKCRELSKFVRINNVSSLDLNNRSITGDNLDHISVDTILTYGCMGLSCISLSFAIAIHKLLSLQNTTPGTNTFNILLNMLLSHVFFMVGIGANDNQIVCSILGMIIHYLWITTFVFMTIGIVHIANAFTKISREPNTSNAKGYKARWKFTITGYIVGLIIVAVSIVVEMVDAIPMKVGYGGKICFPSDYPATLIFVSGPLILSLTINITCLIVTICAICRQLTTCKVLEKAYFTYLTVYIRLTCLSGLLWLFGLMSALFENDVINMLFIVLVGLQGFFISIATTCTSGVFKSLKNLAVSNESTEKVEHKNLRRLC